MEDENKDGIFPIRGKIVNNINSLNKNISSIRCPETGSFIGYKMVSVDSDRVFSRLNRLNIRILKLEIPEDAKRISTNGKKCRCDKAKVLEAYQYLGIITDNDEDNVIASEDTFCSLHDPSFKYHIGEIVSVDDFDDNEVNECSTGIHFFMTKRDVIDYIADTYDGFTVAFFKKLYMLQYNRSTTK